MVLALLLAAFNIGNSIDAKIAIIPITIRSSINVKFVVFMRKSRLLFFFVGCLLNPMDFAVSERIPLKHARAER